MDKHYKILLVEDEDAVREMYKLILSKQGYEVDTAIDGEEAVHKLTRGEPDYTVVLLDIMLPKMDGVSVLKQMRADNSPSKQLPVFVLTNLGQEDLINEAKQLGVKDYWIKASLFPTDLVSHLEEFFQSLGK